jgi:hypothetical protein
MKDCPMHRFTSHSSRRLVAALALATTTAVPALALIAGQTPATALATKTTTVTPDNINMH